MITNPYKIDARKSKAKNTENDANMEPILRSISVKSTWTNNTTKTSRKIMQKRSAKKLWARRRPGPRVPEEVRISSGDLRSRFPLASSIVQKTNIRQTIKKQTRTSGGYLTRTWRAGKHGADLYTYWAHGPPEPSGAWRTPWLFQDAVKSYFEQNNSPSATNLFPKQA